MNTEIPDVTTFNFILRYQGRDVGCEYPITAASYEEVVESRAIYFKFDDNTTHTLFVFNKPSRDYMLSGMPGWDDVTEQAINEIKQNALIDTLVEPARIDLNEAEELLFSTIKEMGITGKRDAISSSGLQEDDWMPTIKGLIAKNLVEKSGVGKHTTYKLIE